jgi:hypothetical protein
MATTVPQAVQSCHELLLWLIPQLDKFPRSRRFTLGERLEAWFRESAHASTSSARTEKQPVFSSRSVRPEPVEG